MLLEVVAMSRLQQNLDVRIGASCGNRCYIGGHSVKWRMVMQRQGPRTARSVPGAKAVLSWQQCWDGDSIET